MASLLLDTHAWVWWIGGRGVPKLSAKAQNAVADAATIYVSMATCIEVAWLEAHERVAFDRDPLTWIAQALARPRVELAPLTPAIAVRAANLDWTHKDPSDRLIVATALERNVPIVTKDQEIRNAGLVRTIW